MTIRKSLIVVTTAAVLMCHGVVAVGATHASAGSGIAFPTPGISYSVAPSSGGAMWLSVGSLRKVTGDGSVSVAATPSGVITTVAATSSSDPWFFIAGGKVGTLNGSGTVSEYTMGYVASQVFALTIGRDGRPWFADARGKLGTVTSAGQVSLVGADVTGANVQFIAAGPNDSAPLWATDIGNDAILKYQMDNSAPVKFDLTAGDDPNGIATGADGNVWFTAFAGNYIGKITTSGTVTRYPLPNAGSSPDQIALGPDGAMWFTERFGDRIGRISTDGTITEYSVPSGTSGPSGIAADQYGNMWVSFALSNFVAKISTGVAPTTAGPTLAGTGEYGLSLVCGGDTWAVTPSTKSTSWYIDGALISGSIGTGYTPSADQVGKAISCKVTAQLPHMITDLVASSDPVTVVKPGESPVSALVVTLQPGPIKGIAGKTVSVKFNASIAADVTMNVVTKSRLKITKTISANKGTNKVSIKLKGKKKALSPGTYRIDVVSVSGKTLDSVKLKVKKAKN